LAPGMGIRAGPGSPSGAVGLAKATGPGERADRCKRTVTRQRVRPSIFQSLTEVCEHCGGMGRVYSPQTVVRRIERTVKRASGSEDTIIVRAHPQVVLRILEKEPHFLERLRRRTGLDLSLVDDPLLREDGFRLLAGPAKIDVTDSYVSG